MLASDDNTRLKEWSPQLTNRYTHVVGLYHHLSVGQSLRLSIYCTPVIGFFSVMATVE